MKFCPNCGAELKPEAKFCAACGTPITVASPPPSQEAPPPPPPVYQQEPVYEHAREASSAFKEAISGKTNIVQRVINIITKPKQEWDVIATEQPNTMKLIGGYALILALIPAISAFIGFGIIGQYSYAILSAGIMQGIMQLFSAVLSVFLLTYVIDLLAPSFDSEKNFGRSMQLAVYSNTAMWLAGIFLILPRISWLAMLVGGIYSIYLLALGVPILKGTSKEKVIGYTALIIIATFLILVVLQAILLAILGLVIFGSMGRFGL